MRGEHGQKNFGCPFARQRKQAGTARPHTTTRQLQRTGTTYGGEDARWRWRREQIPVKCWPSGHRKHVVRHILSPSRRCLRTSTDGGATFANSGRARIADGSDRLRTSDGLPTGKMRPAWKYSKHASDAVFCRKSVYVESHDRFEPSTASKAVTAADPAAPRSNSWYATTSTILHDSGAADEFDEPTNDRPTGADLAGKTRVSRGSRQQPVNNSC